MRIGNLELKNNLFLAPMAGVTDKAFRLMAKPFGPALMYTEMVSGKGLHYKSNKTSSLLEVEDGEKPVAAQIFGHDPEIMGEIATDALHYGAVMIDINMGCPAPKIVNNNDGSAMMKDPENAGKVIAAVRKAVSVPLSVKFRMGWDNDHINAVEFAKIAEANGADAVTVHGRTREAFYSGTANWDIIRQVKEAVSIPVIGNGDVTDGPSAKALLERTGCDGIMVGRAAQGNPWVFRNILHYLETGEVLPSPSLAEQVDIATRHLELLVLHKGEHRGILEGRKHMSWYFKGIQGGATMRDAFNKACTYEEMVLLLQNLISNK